MNNESYTADQIAELLHMHVKTVRRYIREGKLPAAKVGKQWRVTGHDLSLFMEGDRPLPVHSNEANHRSTLSSLTEQTIPKVQVSTVVEMVYESQETVNRVTNTLSAVMQTKDPAYGHSTLNIQVLPNQHKIRVLLWGTLSFIESMLGCIRILFEE